MFHRSPNERLAELRRDVQLIVDRTDDQLGEVDALAASAEWDVRRAEAAVSFATDLDPGQVRDLLSAQLVRSITSAAAVKRLCDSVHQQHAAACQMLAHLGVGDGVAVRTPNAVLVVDDTSDIRETVARVLEEAGFVVGTASNGLEALLAAYEMRPGVIIMDVSMPVLDGIEATRLIKAREETRDARVIAYTGTPVFDDSPTRTLFAAVLSKPATPAAVLATVQHVAGL